MYLFALSVYLSSRVSSPLGLALGRRAATHPHSPKCKNHNSPRPRPLVSRVRPVAHVHRSQRQVTSHFRKSQRRPRRCESAHTRRGIYSGAHHNPYNMLLRGSPLIPPLIEMADDLTLACRSATRNMGHWRSHRMLIRANSPQCGLGSKACDAGTRISHMYIPHVYPRGKVLATASALEAKHGMGDADAKYPPHRITPTYPHILTGVRRGGGGRGEEDTAMMPQGRSEGGARTGCGSAYFRTRRH